MNRPPRGGGSAPSSLYGTEPLGPGTPPGRRSMPPDLQSPRQMVTTPPDLIVRPGFRPGSGGPPGTYRSDPSGAAGPYRPGSGGRQSQADGRETGQAEPMASSGLGRRGTVNLQSYPRMLSRNINGTGKREKLRLTKKLFLETFIVFHGLILVCGVFPQSLSLLIKTSCDVVTIPHFA